MQIKFKRLSTNNYSQKLNQEQERFKLSKNNQLYNLQQSQKPEQLSQNKNIDLQKNRKIINTDYFNDTNTDQKSVGGTTQTTEYFRNYLEKDYIPQQNKQQVKQYSNLNSPTFEKKIKKSHSFKKRDLSQVSSVLNSPRRNLISRNRSFLDSLSRDSFFEGSSEDQRQHLITQRKDRIFSQQVNNVFVQLEQRESKTLLEKISQSVPYVPKDDKPKPIYGQNSYDNYYFYFQNGQKIKQENQYFNIDDSALTCLIDSFDQQGVLPSKLGLVRDANPNQKLKLNNMKYGDKYMIALSDSMKKVNHLNDFELERNRITDRSSDPLLKVISYQAVKLNLAHNQIGDIGCQHIAQTLMQRDCKIMYLNLEENFLGNQPIQLILQSLYRNRMLKSLNLSKNSLTDVIAPDVRTFLENGVCQELYLHWNMFKGQFGQLIFPFIIDNNYLKVLDLSNNSLGFEQDKCVKELCQYIGSNQCLIHFDISFNKLNYDDSCLIAHAIQKNKTIYGFHYLGNSGYVDSKGFIIPEKINTQILNSQHEQIRIKSVKVVQNLHVEESEELRNCCWICQGWVEKEFIFKKDISGSTTLDPLFIHFSFDNYKPRYLGEVKNQDECTEIKYKCMVPTKPVLYCFSDEDENYFFAEDHNRLNTMEQIDLIDIKTYMHNIINTKLDDLNKTERILEKPQQIIDKSNYFQPITKIQPRLKEIYQNDEIDKLKKKRWTFPISLFAKWRQDDAELINLCFEYDWSCSKVQKIVKDQEQQKQIKEFFRERYKLIKDVYKHYSSLYPVGDIWSIQNIAFMELIEACRIIDQNLTMEFINIKWTAVISGVKGAHFIPLPELVQQKEFKQDISNNKATCVDKGESSKKDKNEKVGGGGLNLSKLLTGSSNSLENGLIGMFGGSKANSQPPVQQTNQTPTIQQPSILNPVNNKSQNQQLTTIQEQPKIQDQPKKSLFGLKSQQPIQSDDQQSQLQQIQQTTPPPPIQEQQPKKSLFGLKSLSPVKQQENPPLQPIQQTKEVPEEQTKKPLFGFKTQLPKQQEIQQIAQPQQINPLPIELQPQKGLFGLKPILPKLQLTAVQNQQQEPQIKEEEQPKKGLFGLKLQSPQKQQDIIQQVQQQQSNTGFLTERPKKDDKNSKDKNKTLLNKKKQKTQETSSSSSSDEEGADTVKEIPLKEFKKPSFISINQVRKQSVRQSIKKNIFQKVLSVKKYTPVLLFNPDKNIYLKITNQHIKEALANPVDLYSLLGRNPRNPERGLNRYQMMEAFTRIAEEKYMQITQESKTHYDAIQLLWDDHLFTEFTNQTKYNTNVWRQKRFYNEDCDYVLKRYIKILEHVYKKNSGKKVKPGQSNFMSLEEFNAMIIQAGLYELQWFGSNIYLSAFSNSMMTQIDEIGQDRIFQMSFIEFIEGIGRVAEEACLNPGPGVYNEYQMDTYDKKLTMPLGHKIEGFIMKLYEKCCDKQFKNQFSFSFKKSFFAKNDDEEDFDYID